MECLKSQYIKNESFKLFESLHTDQNKEKENRERKKLYRQRERQRVKLTSKTKGGQFLHI